MPAKQPNIIAIMADDIGIWNIGAYSRGMMAGRTPNLDKLAAEGMLFTDAYGEASCTAGRAAFITGELPIRTGMTTVGQAVPNSDSPPKQSPSPPFSKHRATRQANSARTTSAISMNFFPRFTASTSSSATSITSTRWRIPRTPATRRSC
jgi:Sulfatase